MISIRWQRGLLILAACSIALAAIAAAVPPAFADDAARGAAASHLYAGTLADGHAELAEMLAADEANDDARAGLGVIQFVQGLERLSQGLYRYGLKPPETFLAPVVRLPVPPNPDPQPITYDDFRGLLLDFAADLAATEATLAGVTGDDVRLVLDLSQIRYDVNGDGVIADDERFIAVVQRVTGMQAEDMPASLEFAFDKGDVLWLQAYCNVLMAMSEFFLAHDWHESFDDSFFHFFPAMHSPFRDALKPPGDDNNDQIGPAADLVSFLHIRWPVSEPERLKAARAHLLRMTALSRASWQAIEAETDDDREWLPNAMQTSPFASVPVDAETIAAWYEVLDEVEKVLEGEKLVPHWRLQQGINLKRVFEEPQAFDLVLWLTGPAALPYPEDGPISTSAEWAQITAAFQGSFLLFAVWSN